MTVLRHRMPGEDHFRWTFRGYRHHKRMEMKKLNRDERSDRRTAQYERMKADAPLTVRKMREWLKSPYAFQ